MARHTCQSAPEEACEACQLAEYLMREFIRDLPATEGAPLKMTPDEVEAALHKEN